VAPMEFRPWRRQGRLGRARGGSLARLGADGHWNLGGETAGERRTDSPGWQPPQLSNVRRGRLGGEEERGDEHPRVPGRVMGVLVGENRRSGSVFAVAAFHGAGRQRGWPQGGPAIALSSRSVSGSVASK
jgi:hypothetical protein